MRSVLVVEDEASVRQGLCLVLELHGYTPLCASSTQEALELLREAEEAPTAIVADYRLRNGDTGIAAVHAVCQRMQRDIPGLIISGDKDPGRMAAITDSGLPMLHKPVSPDLLMRMLDMMVDAGVGH